MTFWDNFADLGCFGMYWSVLEHHRTYLNFWDILRRFETFYDVLRHFMTFWDNLAHLGCFGTFWNVLEHFGTYLIFLGHFGTF